MEPVAVPFRVVRRGAGLVCLCADGRAFPIVALGTDRRAVRWWRCLGTAGRPVTPWLATPRIAAAAAARIGPPPVP